MNTGGKSIEDYLLDKLQVVDKDIEFNFDTSTNYVQLDYDPARTIDRDDSVIFENPKANVDNYEEEKKTAEEKPKSLAELKQGDFDGNPDEEEEKGDNIR